jgi:flavin-dependent dehydrogenase
VTERFDVVVVGARCAGSPLAALLARRGVRVAVVERATFPSDTLSSHIFEADALAFLDRLGVTEQLRATGAPFVNRADMRIAGLRWMVDWPQRAGDVGGVASIRRFLLDPILATAAEEAGAEVRMATTVTGLIKDAGRVAGVRVVHGGREAELRAKLVVGADGRSSTVAKLCGARTFNATSNQRFAYWSFFEGADLGPEPRIVAHRWDDRLILACPADSGLYGVGCMPDLAELGRFRRDLEGSLLDHARSCEPVAAVLRGARRVGKVLGAVRWGCYFRQASGAGWVLVGDAGHFKYPAVGRGIGDAFRQVDALAPTIAAALDDGPDALDEAMARWGRSRDRDFAEHYWLAQDMGKAGPVPEVGVEVLRELLHRGEMRQFMDLFNHRADPSKVLSRTRGLRAAGRLLARAGDERRALLRGVGELVAEDARRRLRRRRPAYA